MCNMLILSRSIRFGIDYLLQWKYLLYALVCKPFGPGPNEIGGNTCISSLGKVFVHTYLETYFRKHHLRR